jgi:tetratricopeptide (TPR) repeat protein
MSGKVKDGPPHSRCFSEDDAVDGDDEVAAVAAAEPETDSVRRLYTAALMAEVLDVPPAAVRHWVRGGLLRPVRHAGSLEWFDFEQLVAGRHLARLLSTGLSLREIDAQLARLAPGGAPAAVRVAERIVADGRRLSIRNGEFLLGPGGQMQFSFYTDPLGAAAGSAGRPATLRAEMRTDLVMRPDDEARISDQDRWHPGADGAAEILDLADDLEAAGEFAEAAEALRAVLQARGPAADVMFMLAELLYRSGDLTAARERYYATIEIDPDHLRARTSLGCVLAELGDHELALAALEGVLRQEPGYADAHWHIAGVLRDVGRPLEARHHLALFLALAPESPWALVARSMLDRAIPSELSRRPTDPARH